MSGEISIGKNFCAKYNSSCCGAGCTVYILHKYLMCYQEFQQTNMTRMVNLWKGGGVAKSAIPPPLARLLQNIQFTLHTVYLDLYCWKIYQRVCSFKMRDYSFRTLS